MIRIKLAFLGGSDFRSVVKYGPEVKSFLWWYTHIRANP